MKLNYLGRYVGSMRMWNGSYYELGAHCVAKIHIYGIRLFLHLPHIYQNLWGSKIWNFTMQFINSKIKLSDSDHVLGESRKSVGKRLDHALGESRKSEHSNKIIAVFLAYFLKSVIWDFTLWGSSILTKLLFFFFVVFMYFLKLMRI